MERGQGEIARDATYIVLDSIQYTLLEYLFLRPYFLYLQHETTSSLLNLAEYLPCKAASSLGQQGQTLVNT